MNGIDKKNNYNNQENIDDINNNAENIYNEKLSEFSEKSLRKIAKEIVFKRIVLKIHLVAYIFVNILIFSINYSYLPDKTDIFGYWVLWVITSWGLAVLLHAFIYISFRYGLFTSNLKLALSYHSFITIIICFFLIFADWFSTGKFEWFWWPSAALICALLIHFYTYFVVKPKKNEDPTKSYIERKVDRELRKIKKETQ
ncbi:MAG: 2TM domain-containing protein [Promethearchaeota archaeon]